MNDTKAGNGAKRYDRDYFIRVGIDGGKKRWQGMSEDQRNFMITKGTYMSIMKRTKVDAKRVADAFLVRRLGSAEAARDFAEKYL